MACSFLPALSSSAMAKTLANGEPVRKRARPAKISPLLKAQKKALALAAAHSLREDVEAAITKVDDIIDELALKHGKSAEVIQELLHLGGHVLKSRRSAGINNAYAHCEARCEAACMQCQSLHI
jgi:hypothetical protein